MSTTTNYTPDPVGAQCDGDLPHQGRGTTMTAAVPTTADAIRNFAALFEQLPAYAQREVLAYLDPANRPTPVTSAIQCRPWCEDGTGHLDDVFVEDQRCESPHRVIEASMLEAPGPNQLTVFARQYANKAEHVVLHIYVEEVDINVDLTAAEATELAGALAEAARTIASTDHAGLAAAVPPFV